MVTFCSRIPLLIPIVYLCLLCSRVAAYDPKVLSDTCTWLKQDFGWRGQRHNDQIESPMLWLQAEITDTSVLLHLLQRFGPPFQLTFSGHPKVDAWRSFMNNWSINVTCMPKGIMGHIKNLDVLLFEQGEIDAVSVMTTFAVAYMIHSRLFASTTDHRQTVTTPMVELAIGETKQGLDLYNLYHYSLWLDSTDISKRLPYLKKLAEWHLWWGRALYESSENVSEAYINYFRSLLSEGIAAFSAWISSRNDDEYTYTASEKELLSMPNHHFTVPPFGGATTCFRTAVLLPFQRSCRYSLLLQSIIQHFPAERRIFQVLQQQLSAAITQINLDRKSSELRSDLPPEVYDANGSLLWYTEESNCQVEFDSIRARPTHVALFDNAILFWRSKDMVGSVLRIPRSSIYHFELERENVIRLRWTLMYDDEQGEQQQQSALIRLAEVPVAKEFMRIISTTQI